MKANNDNFDAKEYMRQVNRIAVIVLIEAAVLLIAGWFYIQHLNN